MATAARKARKRAGVPFVKPAKVGTPFGQRAVPEVLKVHPLWGYGFWPSNRAQARIRKQQDAAAGRSRWNKKGSKR